ncbi:putative fumarate hydratase [Candidatus Sulcia muelleri SMDSEM]|uniref:fumarate hydratase n=1 Tax=Karelsulcia muelleri (strain SMDSEM) TaxID=595499 RepID=C7LJX3_KARMS|nr:putative fumarate hydratase [Candidatus Karelsulcia muelleri SMDSEM]
MTFRIEKDSLGTIEVSNKKYWGAQTERSKINFKIGKKYSMPIEIISGLAYLKKAAAITNYELGFLSKKKKKIITKVCDEILEGKLNNNFPLVIWQTGSGTQTNININEVISNRAHVLSGKKLGEGISYINPNEDVNKSQSSNDAFTTAMHIASYKILIEKTIPGIKKLRNSLKLKSFDYKNIIKIGRTHLAPSLGQEFSAYVSQLDKVIKELKNIINNILELACRFDLKVVNYISNLTGFEFKTAKNKLSSHETIVITHGILKNLAISLFKISNDIRMMSSVIGDGEIIIPSPSGKINPIQCEAFCMVSIKVIGNDTTISLASGSGVCKPVIGSNFLESAKLIGEACFSFSKNCISGINPNIPRIKKLLNQSLNLI